MRHLRSILYALVLAPAVWILCGVGFTQDLTGRARDSGTVETTTALLLLVLAGAAYAILVFAPISPLGPAVFGLVFLGVSVWALVAPDSYAGVWPAGVTKEGFDLSRPGYALAALLAVPMLATALSARRWAGYEPVRLPVIGTLGRARGAAVAPGLPVAAEPTTVITSSDPTEVIPPPAAVEAPAAQIAPSPLAEPPTEDVVAEKPAAPSPPAEPATAEVVAEKPEAEAEPATADLSGDKADDGEERTQALRLPVEPADPDAPTRPLELGSATQAAGPGEATQVIFRREPTEQLTPEEVAQAQATADQAARDRTAQERSRQAFKDRAAQERAKEAFAERAAQDAREHGDQTQPLDVDIPGDRTQVLFSGPTVQRPGAGTVEPPGDRTQVLSLPRTTDEPEPPTRANSIAGSEQPDPGADPTTRLSAVRPADGEEPTAVLGDNRRTKSVLGLERPADETADDTRRLAVPQPRRSSEDDEPTTRL